MKYTKLVLWWSMLAFLLLPVKAQHNYLFKHLEVKDGLPNNQVNAVLKDSRGFMWFGTASGLARYDGYEFKTFRNHPNDSTSLPDNYVERILEDGEGNLWLRVGNGRYAIYTPRTTRFDSDMDGWMKRHGMEGTPYMVHIDQARNCWLAAGGQGLYRYAPDAADGEKVSLLKFGGEELPDGWLTDMKECREGLLLAYNDGRVVCVDAGNKSVKWTLTRIAEEREKGRYDVYSLFVDSHDNLWIYGAQGCWVYGLDGRQWRTDMEFLSERNDHRMITSVAEDAEGRIWMGKEDGIDIWDRKTGEMTSILAEPDNERGLPNNTINTLFRDDDGTVWVATNKKGVAYYNESIYKFGVDHVGDVNCFAEAGDGGLWLGTNGGGLIYRNPMAGRRQDYLHDGENSITANVIVCLLKARDGRLWIGTFWGGLDCFDGKRFVHYKNRPDNPNSLANNNVWALAEDRQGNIWIGTLGGGLQCLDPKTGTFVTYTEADGLASDYVATLCTTHDDRLVIGTSSSGVSVMDLNNRQIRKLAPGDSQLSNLSVNQVMEDSRGLIWIATRDGLNLYDPRAERIQVVPLHSDGSGQFISGMTEDRNHTLWVTAGTGIVNVVASMDSKEREYKFSVYHYDEKDGLQGCEFNQRSITCLPTGVVLMGGMYGVNYFVPENIKYNKTLPKVMFADFQLFNESVEVGKEYGGRVILPETLNRLREVTLKYKQNIFTVLLASDNYILPEKTRYLYKLEGFNDEWLKSPRGTHSVTYTNLAPGTYELQVKAVNSDGYEGESVARLKITILPPFWLTTWAYLVYALLLLAALALAWYLVHRRERNKFKIRQMEQDAKKQEEVNQMKFRFFTNVSHELRTPLTLIISPLESMMAKEKDAKQQERLKLMHRNAVRLLNLVNQLLDFRKNEVAGMHLSLSEGDIVSYVRNICSSFLMLSEKKNVHLTFFSALESLNMAFDEDKIGKVVMNLLSNAFKFTPEGGRVDVSLEMMHTDGEILELRVSDTGIGIKDEDKERIFKRFYQVEQTGLDNQSTGSGIGLSLVRDFVMMHGGMVRVVDNVESGSVFIVTLPVKHSYDFNLLAEKQMDEEGKEKETVPADAPAVAGKEKSGKPAEEPAGQPMPSMPGDRKKPLALVVDDNPDLVGFMRDGLMPYFRIQTASNGQEAWQQIPQLMPDIIVSDVMMPEMDGTELCRWLKTDKRTSQIPLILLTAKQAVEDKLEGLKIGADDYVTKPFNMEVLILRMRKLVELSKQGKPRGLIDPEPSELVITSLDEQLVENAVKYVEANISRTDLSVEELAKALNMSRVHLYKKLSQVTGKSPIEFIRIIRLKRAVQLLRDSQLNVSEIAYQVGFNNPKYFTKYFKDEFGVLPSVYQEREGK